MNRDNSVPLENGSSQMACSIGLGCVTFGREIDRDAAFAVMDHAHAHGVVHFDTAAVYGDGASERIIGEWLESRRPAGIAIATKVAPPYDPETLQQGIEQSLHRLGLSTLDIFYLHRWDSSITLESLRVLHGFCKAGKIGTIGISNVRVDALESLITLQKTNGLTAMKILQCNQNLAVSEFTPRMRHHCIKHGLRVVTFSPLGAGFLTGKHSTGVIPGSRFAVAPGHQSIYFKPSAKKRLERLLCVAASVGSTPTHLALAWAFHQPGIDTVLVGGRTPAHLDQAISARKFYAPELFDQLSRAGP